MAAGDLAVRLRADRAATRWPSWDGRWTRWPTNLAATLTALRGERDLLGLILQSMREGVLVLDQDGRMLLVNPALRATLRSPPDAEGRAAARADPQRRAAVDPRAGAARRAAPVTGEIETTGPQPRRLLVHAAPLPTVNGKHQGLLAVFVDVTEMRRLETLRKDFVANVSHELRTPITAVRSAVDTLRLTLARRSDGVGAVRRHHRPQRAAAAARSSRTCSICRASNPRTTGPRPKPVVAARRSPTRR